MPSLHTLLKYSYFSIGMVRGVFHAGTPGWVSVMDDCRNAELVGVSWRNSVPRSNRSEAPGYM
jgi:hypothetical protein